MKYSRWLWNLHQRRKFLRAELSRDILKFSLGNAISRDFQEVFFTADAMLFHQNTCQTRNNTVEMSPLEAFHGGGWFKRFTDLNLLNMRSTSFKTGKQMLYKCYSMVLTFCQQLWYKEMTVAWLRIANQPALLAGHWPLLTALPTDNTRRQHSLLLTVLNFMYDIVYAVNFKILYLHPLFNS